MIFSKQLLFIFIISFFTVFSFAQDSLDLEDLDYLESEDIACEDLPSVFDKFKDDVYLNQISMHKVLTSAVQFLKTSVETGQFVKAELLKKIQDLEQVSSLSMDNSIILSDRAYDISDFLPDCISSSSEN